MSMKKALLIVMCMVAATSAQCPPCDCFPVNTINVTLSELLWYSPLYTQVASVVSLPMDIDSVCLSLTGTCTTGNVLTEQGVIFINGTTSSRASIQTTASVGTFSVTGPARTYYDRVLGNPCAGTYTLYRCQVTGNCVTDVANVDVIVVSTRVRDSESCIKAGVAIAEEAFPGLQFYGLPKKTDRPCQCTAFGCY